MSAAAAVSCEAYLGICQRIRLWVHSLTHFHGSPADHYPGLHRDYRYAIVAASCNTLGGVGVAPDRIQCYVRSSQAAIQVLELYVRGFPGFAAASCC